MLEEAPLDEPELERLDSELPDWEWLRLEDSPGELPPKAKRRVPSLLGSK